jgi:hypothetical protein
MVISMFRMKNTEKKEPLQSCCILLLVTIKDVKFMFKGRIAVVSTYARHFYYGSIGLLEEVEVQSCELPLH